jgi:hypothetical protein
MLNTVHLRRSDPTVDALVRAAFPEFTGKNVIASIQDHVRFYGTMWEEGCRRQYVIVRLEGLVTYPIPTAPFRRRSPRHEEPYKVPSGYVVVVHCVSRWEHIEIISPAENVSKLLPPPAELSEDEQVVLVATCGLKSSYGGISNYRFHEARRHTGITPERYEAAKRSLIARKFLNKAGAVTPEGRNARPATDLFELRRRRGRPAPEG